MSACELPRHPVSSSMKNAILRMSYLSKHFKASGSADAYYMLGVIYEQGCGSVGKNAMMARQNFKKAADLGNAKAKAKL